MPKEQNFDTLLVTKSENIFYLSGFTGEGILLMKSEELRMKNEKVLFTDARYLLRAEQETKSGVRIVLADKGFEKTFRSVLKNLCVQKLGFEASHLTFARLANFRKRLRGTKITLVPMENIIEQMREVKSKTEIQLIRRACQITTRVLEKVLPFVKVGCTEIEVAEEIRRLAFALGAEKLAFDTIVVFGVNSAIPHAKPSHKKLKKGDVVLFDLGVMYGGYCSDCSRTFFTRPPIAKEKQVYEAVRLAQKSALAKIQNGVSAKIVDEAARASLRRNDLEKFFIHALGHGVGIEIHEAPSLFAKSNSILRAGNIVTVEPGVYLPKEFGVRIEDTVLVTKTGAEILTRFPKELRVLKIRG